jgi:hypothetical protein
LIGKVQRQSYIIVFIPHMIESIFVLASNLLLLTAAALGRAHAGSLGPQWLLLLVAASSAFMDHEKRVPRNLLHKMTCFLV